MHFRGGCSHINVMFNADRVIILLTGACKQCLRAEKDAVWGKLRNPPLAQFYSINLLACACWLKYLASKQNLTSQSRDVGWERGRERVADRHDTSHRVRTWANDVANRLNFDSPTGPKNCSLRMLTAIWKSLTRTPEKKQSFIMINPQTAVVWKSSIKAERLWRESDSDAFFLYRWSRIVSRAEAQCVAAVMKIASGFLWAVCLWGR